DASSGRDKAIENARRRNPLSGPDDAPLALDASSHCSTDVGEHGEILPHRLIETCPLGCFEGHKEAKRQGWQAARPQATAAARQKREIEARRVQRAAESATWRVLNGFPLAVIPEHVFAPD